MRSENFEIHVLDVKNEVDSIEPLFAPILARERGPLSGKRKAASRGRTNDGRCCYLVLRTAEAPTGYSVYRFISTFKQRTPSAHQCPRLCLRLRDLFSSTDRRSES